LGLSTDDTCYYLAMRILLCVVPSFFQKAVIWEKTDTFLWFGVHFGNDVKEWVWFFVGKEEVLDERTFSSLSFSDISCMLKTGSC
jgi:hypothetical protein